MHGRLLASEQREVEKLERAWNDVDAELSAAERFVKDCNAEAEANQAELERMAEQRKSFHHVLRKGTHMETNAFEKFLRHGGQPYFDIPLGPIGAERMDLTKGASPGTELVPQGFGTFVQAFVAESGVLQTNAQRLETDSGETVIVPKQTGFGTATLVAEGAAIGETDPTIAQVTLGAYKLAAMMQASREVVEDSAVNVSELVGNSLGKAIGALAAQYYVTGTGSGQPRASRTPARPGSLSPRGRRSRSTLPTASSTCSSRSRHRIAGTHFGC